MPGDFIAAARLKLFADVRSSAKQIVSSEPEA
jgi:hypothetical protein